MDIMTLVLFDPATLHALLYYWRQEVIGADWVWHYDLGYVDEEARNTAWVKKVFGWN